MKKSTIITILIIVSIVAAGLIYYASYLAGPKNNITPTPTPNLSTKAEILDQIIVDAPLINQAIASPLDVEGKAVGFWFFEASFPVSIYDDNGFLLGQIPAQAQEDWMTEKFVPFKVQLLFSVPSTVKGVLVLEKDNPSGLPENSKELRIPVIFPETTNFSSEKMTIKIFLSDANAANEPTFDCQKTVAVDRQVPRTSAVARAALEALLRGPTSAEKAKNQITTINPGVRINNITIENGVAKVDFNEQLEYAIGGSCMVAAIRSQITDTLKQFISVKSVIISINGRTEDILQP